MAMLTCQQWLRACLSSVRYCIILCYCVRACVWELPRVWTEIKWFLSVPWMFLWFFICAKRNGHGNSEIPTRTQTATDNIFKNDGLMKNPRPSKEDENANAQNASVNDDGVQRCWIEDQTWKRKHYKHISMQTHVIVIQWFGNRVCVFIFLFSGFLWAPLHLEVCALRLRCF
jgi:hypothetical protein